MDRIVKFKVGQQLMNEVDTILRYYYKITLDEVLTELRVRCMMDQTSDSPVDIITALYQSRLLHLRSDKPVLHLRNAIERYMSGSIGRCLHCGADIPDEWLLRNPMVMYCSHCMVKMRPLHTQPHDEQYQSTVRG